MSYLRIDPALGRIDPTYTFFMKSYPLDQGFLPFKKPKLASCARGRERHNNNHLISYFRVFGCKENPTFLLFSKLFLMDFLEKMMG